MNDPATDKYIHDINLNTPFEVLDKNYIEQIVAVLNYSYMPCDGVGNGQNANNTSDTVTVDTNQGNNGNIGNNQERPNGVNDTSPSEVYMESCNANFFDAHSSSRVYNLRQGEPKNICFASRLQIGNHFLLAYSLVPKSTPHLEINSANALPILIKGDSNREEALNEATIITQSFMYEDDLQSSEIQTVGTLVNKARVYGYEDTLVATNKSMHSINESLSREDMQPNYANIDILFKRETLQFLPLTSSDKLRVKDIYMARDMPVHVVDYINYFFEGVPQIIHSCSKIIDKDDAVINNGDSEFVVRPKNLPDRRVPREDEIAYPEEYLFINNDRVSVMPFGAEKVQGQGDKQRAYFYIDVGETLLIRINTESEHNFKLHYFRNISLPNRRDKWNLSENAEESFKESVGNNEEMKQTILEWSSSYDDAGSMATNGSTVFRGWNLENLQEEEQLKTWERSNVTVFNGKDTIMIHRLSDHLIEIVFNGYCLNVYDDLPTDRWLTHIRKTASTSEILFCLEELSTVSTLTNFSLNKE